MKENWARNTRQKWESSLVCKKWRIKPITYIMGIWRIYAKGPQGIWYYNTGGPVPWDKICTYLENDPLSLVRFLSKKKELLVALKCLFACTRVCGYSSWRPSNPGEVPDHSDQPWFLKDYGSSLDPCTYAIQVDSRYVWVLSSKSDQTQNFLL